MAQEWVTCGAPSIRHGSRTSVCPSAKKAED
jgi:hypothetical protein